LAGALDALEAPDAALEAPAALWLDEVLFPLHAVKPMVIAETSRSDTNDFSFFISVFPPAF